MHLLPNILAVQNLPGSGQTLNAQEHTVSVATTGEDQANPEARR